MIEVFKITHDLYDQMSHLIWPIIRAL